MTSTRLPRIWCICLPTGSSVDILVVATVRSHLYFLLCSVIETDIHGDSPLHAAASGGSARCIELLVRHSRSIGQPLVNPCNKMEMTPAHLAKNVSSMEALFANGASFTVRDSSLRSPLFIAAAMNRSDCVQYIIGMVTIIFSISVNTDCCTCDVLDNCLEGNDDELYSSDVRGDTPLHAASCNGIHLWILLVCIFDRLK